jgi:hypothetical protein
MLVDLSSTLQHIGQRSPVGHLNRIVRATDTRSTNRYALHCSLNFTGRMEDAQCQHDRRAVVTLQSWSHGCDQT